MRNLACNNVTLPTQAMESGSVTSLNCQISIQLNRTLKKLTVKFSKNLTVQKPVASTTFFSNVTTERMTAATK